MTYNTAEMIDSFESAGVRVPTGSGNVKVKCPKCGKENANLSVNRDTGQFNCHRPVCNWHGAVKDRQQEYRPPATTPEPYRAPQVQPATPSVINWFKDRGITKETLEAFKIQSITVYSHVAKAKTEHAALPFMVDKQALNWKYRCIADKAFSQSKGGEQCFFNLDGVQSGDVLVITEGEIDAMAVYQSGIRQVVSCPNGAPPVGCKDFEKKLMFLRSERGQELIQSSHTIVLAMDNDEPGIAWRDVLAKEIGEEKVKIADWPEGCKDANDVLLSHGPEIVLECIALAKAVPVAGIESFADHRDTILEYMKIGGTAQGIPTGWTCLDDIWRLATKQLNIITGIPMSGKSEWLDAMMLNSIQKYSWKWAVFSPENYPLEFHFQKLTEKLIGKPMFPKFGETPLNVEEVKSCIAWLDTYIKPIGVDEALPTLDALLRLLKVCVVRYGVKGVIIDPYNEVARDPKVSETDFVSGFLSQLRNFSRLHDVAVFIVAHPTKLRKKRDNNGNETNDYPVPTPYDISGSAHWRNKADTCFSVWRDLAKGGNAIDIHIQKVKNKNLGTCGMAKLYWNKHNGRFEQQQIQGA